MSEINPVYKELAAKIGKPDSEVMPRLLAKLAGLEQARILNELSASTDAIAKKLNMNKDLVDTHMQELFEKGLAFPGRTGWHLTRSWAALHDQAGAANAAKHKDSFDAEFFDLLHAASEEDRKERVDVVVSGKAPLRTGMRVIPRWKSIKDIPGLLPYEDVRQIFKAMDPIALLPCACKRAEPGRKCEDNVPEVSCITTGRSAQYNINRGAGRKLTYDEVMEILDSFDKLQLVHLVGNSNRMPLLICNCHSCCCGMFIVDRDTKKLLNKDTIVKSRFIAVVDPEKCRECKTCVKKECPIGADEIRFYPELGQERAYVDPEKCIGCGLCVINCANGARTMKVVRPPDHIPEPSGVADAD
jgi:electron transport complex protein RnfB